MSMNTRSYTLLPIVAALALGTAQLLACSEETTPGPSASGPPADAGTTGDDDDDDDDDVDSGAGSTTVNGCRSYTDRTADDADRQLQWDLDFPSSEVRCIRIKVGQEVTFGDGAGGVADFAAHPVGAKGGDADNPIDDLDTDTGKVTFDAAGTYGFGCTVHPGMLGAVLVTP